MASESPANKRKRILSMRRYLGELKALTGRVVNAEELGSLEQARALREHARSSPPKHRSEHNIDFSQRLSGQFAAFVQALQRANPAPVHLWTEDTVDCGVLLLPSISAVRFDFAFDLNDAGLLVVSTADQADALLLDWSRSATGEQALQVEATGPHWSKVSY